MRANDVKTATHDAEVKLMLVEDGKNAAGERPRMRYLKDGRVVLGWVEARS